MGDHCRGLTELEGLRLSWDSISGGNWKSAGRVVFLLVTLRADLLFVVAACGEKSAFNSVYRQTWCVLSSGWASFHIPMIPIAEYYVAMATLAKTEHRCRNNSAMMKHLWWLI